MHRVRVTVCTIISFLPLLVSGQGAFQLASQSSGFSTCVNDIADAGGVVFFDYDNDGFEDLYVLGGLGTDRLYHNQGDGTFNDVTTQAGLTGTQTIGTIGATTGDINNDGYRDLFITSLLGQSNILYKNNGDGTFTDISASANIQFPASRGYSAVMGDYNQDSYLDIYVVNYGLSAIVVLDSNGQAVGYNPTGLDNNLYVNNGDETFSQMAVPLNVNDSGTGLVAAFTDFDNDRDVDLLVGNDFGPWLVSQSLFRNDYPTNDFTDISAASGVVNPALYAMGIAVGDYDGDMDLDYYMTSIGAHALFNNQGNNTFQDMAPFAGVVDEFSNDSNYTSGWGTVFFDYDLDTDVDLFVSKGFIGTADFIPVDPKNSNKLYQNNGNGTFADVTVAEFMNDSGHARGAIYGDYDNDGDLDLVVGRASCITNPDPGGNSHFWFYRNNAAGGNHHWVKFKLEGVASNRDGFGAHVRVYFNGQALLREVDGGSSFLSQNSSIVHFGLGTNSLLDTVIVDWPNGHTDTLYQLPADESYRLIEDSVLMVSRSQVLELCEGDSIFLQGGFQSAAGVYSDVHAGATPQDLDTLVLTQLKVYAPEVTSASASICAGDSLFLAGAFRTASGTYSDTLTSALGCDSVHHFVTLTVLDTFLTEQQVSICAGDSFLAGGAYQQTAGTYFDHLHTQNGCDSLVATQLTVDNHVATDTAITIIDGDSIFLGGSFQTTTGIYLDTLVAANGCDSVVTTTLDVITSITFPGGDGNSYGLRIIPNPANDVVSITFSQPQSGSVKFSLLALDGRLLEQWQHNAAGGNEQRISRSIGHLASGTYLLRLQDATGGTSVKRVVIHHP